MLCFAATKTVHRAATRIEDAGFNIIDQISWIYSRGYPFSCNYEEKIKAELTAQGLRDTSISQKFLGYTDQLRPSCEPIIVAQKPISTKTFTLNLIEHGTGALNTGGCQFDNGEGYKTATNLIHDGSPEIVAEFPKIGGKCTSRFFYVPKPSRKERNAGLNGLPKKGKSFTGGIATNYNTAPQENFHDTVKPVKLMQHLVRLVTPSGGTCIDLYNGSGTTGVACAKEGFSYIGVEMNKEYCDISIGRINEALRQVDGDLTCTLATSQVAANDPNFQKVEPAA